MRKIKKYVEDRAYGVAYYMLQTKRTIRQASSEFGIAKTTVHYDLTKILPQLDVVLFNRIRILLDTNKLLRATRGGLATKLMYQKRKELLKYT